MGENLDATLFPSAAATNVNTCHLSICPSPVRLNASNGSSIIADPNRLKVRRVPAAVRRALSCHDPHTLPIPLKLYWILSN